MSKWIGIMTAVVVSLVLSAAQADTITWNTNSGAYNTAGNWNPPQVPGNDDVAVVDRADAWITYGSYLQWATATDSTFVWNQSDGVFTNTSRWIPGNGNSSQVDFNLSGGDFVVNDRIYAAQGVGSVVNWNISGGTLITKNQNIWGQGSNATLNINISGTGTLAPGANANLGVCNQANGGQYTQLTLSDSGTVSAGNAFHMCRNSQGSTARITVIGNQATFNAVSCDNNYGGGGTRGTWEFQLSAAGAVSPINFSGTAGINNNFLEVKNELGDGNIGDLVLFNYGSLNGTFGSISVTNLTYDAIVYDYPSPGGTSIALTNVELIGPPKGTVISIK
jgi:hypothetical protein